MAELKTNYKDDVLDVSKNTKRKYNMIQNSDGTVSLDDVTEYTQQGDDFGGADINATNTKVNEIDNSLTDTPTGESFNFGVKDGVRGFYTNPSRADDSFVPFSSGASPFLTFRPVRDVYEDWLMQLVLFDGKNADIYIDVNQSYTHSNSNFVYTGNNVKGTLKFLKAGKYYINSQGITTDLTASNDKKVVDIAVNTIINWNIVSSIGYLVIVKVE